MATVHRRAWTPAVILLAALAGLCAAQTPLTPGAAPVTQTLALATDTADFSAAMGTGSKAVVVLESCTDGAVFTVSGGASLAEATAGVSAWVVSSNSSGYARFEIDSSLPATLYLHVSTDTANSEFSIAVGVDGPASIDIGSSVLWQGAASTSASASVRTDAAVQSASMFLLPNVTLTTGTWSKCVLEQTYTAVAATIALTSNTTEGLTYTVSYNSLALETTYTIVIVLTGVDGQEIVIPPFEVITLPYDGCAFVSDMPFCENLRGAMYVGTSTALDIDADAESSFNNFTRALSEYNCDIMYSPVRNCFDCLAGYQEWVCQIKFQECSSKVVDPEAPAPFNSIIRPCVDVCWNTRQSCPTFLGFECPIPNTPALLETYGACSAATRTVSVSIGVLAIGAALLSALFA